MIGYLEIDDMERNVAECKAYTRRHAKTFYFASHVLPREKRRAAYAVYAFCRYADDLVDHTMPGADTHVALARLSELRRQLMYVYSFSELMDRKLLALRETVFQYRIPQQYFDDLLRGVEMDLTKTRYESFAELKEYCYCVASVVGLVMSRIFGVSDPGALKQAADLGTAMQLTNILRDVGEDYALGRIYLPSDEMNFFGYTEVELAQGIVSTNLKRMMRFQIARAREFYANGAAGIPQLTNDGSRFCVRLMARTYEKILESIERNDFDVFSKRAYVTSARKLWIAVGAALSISRPSEYRTKPTPVQQTRETVKVDRFVFAPNPQKS